MAVAEAMIRASCRWFKTDAVKRGEHKPLRPVPGGGDIITKDPCSPTAHPGIASREPMGTKPRAAPGDDGIHHRPRIPRSSQLTAANPVQGRCPPSFSLKSHLRCSVHYFPPTLSGNTVPAPCPY